MESNTISLRQARRMALYAQLLDGQVDLPNGKEGVMQSIEKLGYVQIDTIAVIRRAHHHTLWTRRKDYEPEMLHELQSKDRRVFEYWAHAMSYLSMKDYRYFLPRMRNFHQPGSKWAQILLQRGGHLMDAVLERIRREGPLGAKDFQSQRQKKGAGWWDWKPAKHALELLFWKGELMISERRNFQKIYDLTERVLPAEIDTRHPDEHELGCFQVRRALLSLGVAQKRDINGFLQPETSRDSEFQIVGKEALEKSLQALQAENEVVCVNVRENEDAEYYALPETLEKTAKLRQMPLKVSLLSPFDNLVIQRDRLKRLFGFDYALECYTPAAKRKYGYFVLPILRGDNFVGRLDPKADRPAKTLRIRNLVFEPGFLEFEEFLPSFAEKLIEFARFNHCEKIALEKVSPGKLKPLLQRHLKCCP